MLAAVLKNSMAKLFALDSDAAALHKLGNAFRETRGEEEARLDYFVHGPQYDAILGEPSNPRTSYVFGAAGSGKTSYRLLMMQNYLPSERESRVLGVNYLEARTVHEIFSAALSDATMELHWKLLFQTILSALLQELLRERKPLEKLSQIRRAQLFGLFQSYLPILNDSLTLADYLNDWGHPDLARAVEMNETPSEEQTRKRLELIQELRAPISDTLPPAPINQFIRLTDVLAHMGFEKVCVFVDGLDEFVGEGNWEAATRFLLPLCEHMARLSKHLLVFKFFLPESLAELLEERGIKPEPRFDLEWTDAQLGELLRRRLHIESDGKIVALKEFAFDAPLALVGTKPKVSKPSAKKRAERTSEEPKEKQPLTKRLDDDLIANAYGSPRRLMRLCQLLFEALKQHKRAEELFTEEDLEWTLKKYQERFGSSVPLLTIDVERQRALLGARELKLSASDFKCLLFLAEAEGRLRTKNEIWKALWGEEEAVGDEAIDTFMSRLRKKLERGSLYVITERGKGSRLDNFNLVRK